ncbi:MAG TPA: hypothetical protein VN224_04245 [Xanthomonadales bacterium]|nr:hypothetical protein [Xanthomonadales bacterium]
MMLLAQASTQDSSAAATAAIAAFGIVYLIVVLAALAFSVLCNYMIAKKAGYNPWLSLLMLVPVANIIVFLIFVFSEWPVTAENNALRAQLAGGGGYSPPPGGGYTPPPYPPGPSIAPGGPITPA